MRQFTLIVLACLAVAPLESNADPIVVTQACDDHVELICTVGIDDLDLSGTLYDVDFVNDTYDSIFASADPLFIGDYSAANAAVAAIQSVLNAAARIFDAIGNGGIGATGSIYSSIVLVPGATSTSANNGYCVLTEQGSTYWSRCTYGRYNDSIADASSVYESYAVFRTATDVPEPGTLLLMGIGLAALARAKGAGQG